MNRTQKLLLPLALVAGAAVPALAVADEEDCLVPDRSVTVTSALADAATTNPLREAAVLSFTASDPDAELRVKLRQDGVRGDDEDDERGRGRRGGVRVVEVGEDAYRVSVRKPEGGDVTFTTDRVRSRPGALKLRLRAVVADAEGEPVRSYRATVQVKALQEVCADEDEAGTTTGEAGTTTGEAGTTTGETVPEPAQRSVSGADDDDRDEDERKQEEHEDDDEREGGRRGRGRGGRD